MQIDSRNEWRFLWSFQTNDVNRQARSLSTGWVKPSATQQIGCPSVIDTTAAALIVDLSAQESGRALERRLARYGRCNPLVMDEVGYLDFDAPV